MAAGLGFKDFVTGEVLTAADVDGYLMQGVWVFASAAARDAAVTSPQEGNFAYLKDTNVTTYYTGSAWANLDTTGMTNPMTTTGDTIYSSSGSTPARLAIGSTGNVLTVAGGVPTWAAPAASSSGLTLIAAPTSFSAVTSQSLNNVFTSTYLNYKILITLTSTSASSGIQLRFRASGSDNTTSNYNGALVRYRSSSATITDYAQYVSSDYVALGESGFTASPNSAFIEFTCNSPQASQNTYVNGQASNMDDGFVNFAMHKTTTSFDGFTIIVGGGNNMTGNIAVYGLAK